MTRLPLTEKQQQIYDFIIAQNNKNKVCPNLADIAKHVQGFASNVSVDIDEIIERGWPLKKKKGMKWGLYVEE